MKNNKREEILENVQRIVVKVGKTDAVSSWTSFTYANLSDVI